MEITQGNLKMEVFNGVDWVEANGFQFTMLEPQKGNTIFPKEIKNEEIKGQEVLIGAIKNITISKGADSSNFNVVGIEWSPREFMFTFINAARGSHQWGGGGTKDLQNFQDGDIWEFNPDLIISEVTTINWGTSISSRRRPFVFMSILQKKHFLMVLMTIQIRYMKKSNQYQDCEIIFYGGTSSAGSSDAWDEYKNPVFTDSSSSRKW